MKLISLSAINQQNISHNDNIKKQMMLAPGEIKHLMYFSQAIFPVGEIAKSHQHTDMTEIFFVLSGQGTIRINNNVYPLNQNDCAVVEPNEDHEICNTGNNDLVINYFGVQVS